MHRGVVIFWHAEVVVFVVIPLIDVETLATWVVTLVTCEHEVSHGTGITESGEIPTEVGVVLFLGTRGPVG
jgi:hypothetical protein